MGGGEGLGDAGGLAPGEGADRVDQAAAGFERTGHLLEQAALHDGQLLDVVERGGPSGVGVAGPGAEAGAGGVDEDAVELRLGGQVVGRLPGGETVVVELGAAEAALEILETALGAVAAPERALVGHLVGEVERLAAFAGADVPPGLAGLRGAEGADDLRGEILDLERAGVEGLGDVEVGRAGVAQGVGGERMRGGFAAAEGLREGGGAAGAGAQPERRPGLEGAQPRELAALGGGGVGVEVELRPDPLGHGEGGERLVLDAARVLRETLLDLGGGLDLHGQPARLEPALPAEIGEDGARELLAAGLREMRVAAHEVAQRLVGVHAVAPAADGFGGVVVESGGCGHR